MRLTVLTGVWLIASLAAAPQAQAPDADGTTALHRAVQANDLAGVQRLIRAGADVATANRYNVTPLSLAAGNGNAAITVALLAAGADANSTSGEGEPVLM